MRNSEVGSVDGGPARPGWRGAVVALHHRNFALFWGGAMLSNTGAWVQTIAVGYVVYQETQSDALVSIAAFIQFAPILLMGPLGGSLADRHDRRQLLLISQTGQALVTFALWALWIAGYGSVPVVLGMTAIGGFINGAAIPAWQAFVAELVPRSVLRNAVTLNSAQFSGSRAFGPALGGLVLATFGAGASFLINAVSYVAVVMGLVLIRRDNPVRGTLASTSVWRSFVDAIRYSRTKPGILGCYLMVVALGGLGSPFVSLLPGFSERVFSAGVVAYGILGAGMGIGAILAFPVVAGPAASTKRSWMSASAMAVYGISMVAFVGTSVYWVGLFALIVAGASYLVLASMLNTTIQLQVDEAMRGKVLALYLMLLTSSLPLGLLVQSALVGVIGVQWTTIAFAAGFLLVLVWLRTSTPYLEHLDDEATPAVSQAA